MKMLRTLRFASRVVAFGINTIVCWFCYELSSIIWRSRSRIDAINVWVPRWARINLWIFGVTVDLHGPHVDQGQLYPRCGENGIGRIFVANHSSGFDIPLMFVVAEAHCISRHDVANWPLIGPGAKRVGTLFVDRASRKSGASALKQVEEVLAQGEAVAMFPEGTVSPGDEILRFRNGAFNAARRAGAEIVPLGIAYGDAAAYYGSKQNFMAHIKEVASLKRLRVAVEIAEPIPQCDLSSMEVKDLAHDQVQELVHRARARLDSAPK